MESDIALARHVTFVHQFKKNPELDFEPFDPKFLKLYISQVRATKDGVVFAPARRFSQANTLTTTLAMPCTLL